MRERSVTYHCFLCNQPGYTSPSCDFRQFYSEENAGSRDENVRKDDDFARNNDTGMYPYCIFSLSVVGTKEPY